MITMEPLEIAIEMEMEGRAFYRNASDESRNVLGKTLFTRLAKEEDFHAAKAAEILEFLNRDENPLAIEESLDRGKKLRAIFTRAEDSIDLEAISEEIELIQSALDVEETSSNFYQQQSESVKNDFERRFFKALISEEHMHRLSLMEYQDYLADPSRWFKKGTHVFLDNL